ncbi:S49 family peptidase [Candidatus Pacearchaeota archaeon]|jgi:signal peptide peptidase SppA|nr:S49 family peptidase [Candidatus Pacearchaeota archaeon]
MDAMIGFLDAKACGMTLDAATVERVAASNRLERKATISRSVAVLPVVGIVAQRMDLMSEFSGGVSTDRLGKEFDALVINPDVEAIVLDVDSPGGGYAGTPEMASRIMAARGSKPIVAVANSMAASAAYWIAAACDELVVTPSGEVGSIGVLAIHYDYSTQNEKLGVKPTYVTYGENKAEFSSDSPLTEAALSELQARVNEAGETFVKAVASQRGVSQKAVRETFGGGRMFSAEEAVLRRMADRIGTLNAEISRLASGKRSSGGGRRAAIERERLALERLR